MNSSIKFDVLTDVECGIQYKCFQPHPKNEVNLCSTRLWDLVIHIHLLTIVHTLRADGKEQPYTQYYATLPNRVRSSLSHFSSSSHTWSPCLPIPYMSTCGRGSSELIKLPFSLRDVIIQPLRTPACQIALFLLQRPRPPDVLSADMLWVS